MPLDPAHLSLAERRVHLREGQPLPELLRREYRLSGHAGVGCAVARKGKGERWSASRVGREKRKVGVGRVGAQTKETLRTARNCT